MESNENSKKIRALRLYLNMSMSEFAKETGLSTTHISRLEKGIIEPGESVLKKISMAFNVDEKYFTSEMSENDVEKAVGDITSKDGLTVGTRLKMLREQRGMTQQMLADKAGCLQSLITDVERGKRKLTDEKAEKIADALRMGVEYLLYGDETKKSYPVNKRLISWLWERTEIRRELWEQLDADHFSAD